MGACDSMGFSVEGVLISEAAVPHHRRKKKLTTEDPNPLLDPSLSGWSECTFEVLLKRAFFFLEKISVFSSQNTPDMA